jgi:hypothetical protein
MPLVCTNVRLHGFRMTWSLHFSEAEGGLDAWRDRLTDETIATHKRIGGCLAPDVVTPAVNVVIQRARNRVIADLGLVGLALDRARIRIMVDPDNPNFASSLAAGQFSRVLAHEFHHCLRHAGAGYGATLAEALVSEGLADHFDREIHGGEGQIWNHALKAEQWPVLLRRAAQSLRMPCYSHKLWFFGTRPDRTTVAACGAVGANGYPRWAGYTIGYHLVGAYLGAHPGARPSRMAATPAEVVIKVWPRLCAKFGVTVQ